MRQQLARKWRGPLFEVDHEQLRKNLVEFKRYLPQVKPYFAVKANPLPMTVVHINV